MNGVSMGKMWFLTVLQHFDLFLFYIQNNADQTC